MTGNFKNKVENSKDLLAPLVSIYDPSVTESLLSTKPDLLIVDMEHSVIGIKELQGIMMAAAGTPVLARIKGLDRYEIKKVLDTGVSGIIVPGIRTVEEAEMAVSYSRLPPAGIRGAGPGRASRYGYEFEEYTRTANTSLTIIQIETEPAYRDLERILSVPGLDGYFIGPIDLSISLGISHSWDVPEFYEAIDRIVKEGKKRNLIGGIYTPLSGSGFSSVKKRGFNFIMFGTDRQALTQTYAESMKNYRGL